MNLQTIKNKIIGRIKQFLASDLGKRLIVRAKSLAWRYGVFLAVSALAYFTSQVLPTLKLDPIFVAGIAYICNEITKELNK